MRVGNFTVLIPEGTEHGTGHVRIAHGTQYTIKLMNGDTYRRCDAVVKIDGKEIGGFQLGPLGGLESWIVLERAPHDKGRFTAHAAGSEEGQAGGAAAVEKADRGVIEVTFLPEKKRVQQPVKKVVDYAQQHLLRSSRQYADEAVTNFDGSERSVTPAGFKLERQTSAAVTTLTGSSDQEFLTVPPLDHDEALKTVITLRLVTEPAVRPLTAAPKGNPVPAPVE